MSKQIRVDGSSSGARLFTIDGSTDITVDMADSGKVITLVGGDSRDADISIIIKGSCHELLLILHDIQIDNLYISSDKAMYHSCRVEMHRTRIVKLSSMVELTVDSRTNSNRVDVLTAEKKLSASDSFGSCALRVGRLKLPIRDSHLRGNNGIYNVALGPAGKESGVVSRVTLAAEWHGAVGRTLHGFRCANGKRYFSCGCFFGTGAELKTFIETDDDNGLEIRRSRRAAFNLVNTALNVRHK